MASEVLTVPVAAKLLHPNTDTYWGPTFQLMPTIKASGDRLLGNASDFFELFEVAFSARPRRLAVLTRLLTPLRRPGTYKVNVVATTVLNQHLSGSHTYKSCTKGSEKIKLKRVKKHHG